MRKQYVVVGKQPVLVGKTYVNPGGMFSAESTEVDFYLQIGAVAEIEPELPRHRVPFGDDAEEE